MSPARPAPKLFGFFLLCLIFVSVLCYGLFEARKLLSGPQVSIETPQDGSATSTSAVLVTGDRKSVV